MAHQTPRQRLARPSYGTAGSAEKQSFLSASTTVNRKASLQALTGFDPRTPAPIADETLEVGDIVNVPGDMFGIVRFLGSVRGKNGKFIGVELDEIFAAKGKNNGDVEGIQYFTTDIPGAGIFLPVHRAERRLSPTGSSDAFPNTPNTPSHSTVNGLRTNKTPTTPGHPKFSQSMGPGAQRPISPQFKAKRPSLPRPESPFRKPAPNLQPTPARNAFSQSQRGGRPPLNSNTPSRNTLRQSTTANTRAVAGQTPRAYSRTGSRMGSRDANIEEDRPALGRKSSTGVVPSFAQSSRSPSRLGSSGSDAEVQRLKAQLSERDRRLDEQAASLAEMEASVKELSAIMPVGGPPPGDMGRSTRNSDDGTVSQLRQMLKEKNDKIGALTQEFDTHRADFRSTLDSLEMASAETERVYEEQKRDLVQQINELQELNQQSQDFEAVASQLRQLEELVAELEEGLEESRRGEAEARGEVEFLRGEVERGRSELRREREKAAAVLKYTESGRSLSPRGLEQKEEEIQGLKAVINRMSANSNASNSNNNGYAADVEEIDRLRSELDRSNTDKEELERELEQLRRQSVVPNGNHQPYTHNRQESEVTALGRPPAKATFAEHVRRRSGMDERGEDEHNEQHNGEDGIYCEMCGSEGHDTLDCKNLSHDSSRPKSGAEEQAYSPGKENEHHSRDASPEKRKSEKAAPAAVDEDKWCALCEKDGHLAFDCPEEQY